MRRGGRAENPDVGIRIQQHLKKTQPKSPFNCPAFQRGRILRVVGGSAYHGRACGLWVISGRASVAAIAWACAVMAGVALFVLLHEEADATGNVRHGV